MVESWGENCGIYRDFTVFYGQKAVGMRGYRQILFHQTKEFHSISHVFLGPRSSPALPIQRGIWVYTVVNCFSTDCYSGVFGYVYADCYYCVNTYTMLLVWLDQLDLDTRDHIVRIDPHSHYWPRSQRYNLEYDYTTISEWYISFSRDPFGFQFVLAYPERVQIIESANPKIWRCRAV